MENTKMEKKPYKRPKTDYLELVLSTLLVWIIATSTIFRFIHPEKTETQIFLHISKSLVLDFK